MNNLIVYMTLTGSLPILIYYLIRFVLKERVSAKALLKLLYISMLFFLLPFPMLSPLLNNHSPLRENGIITSVSELASEKLILISENHIKLQHYSFIFYIISFIWLLIFILAVCKTFFSYRRFRADLYNTTTYKENFFIKKLCFSRKVEIRLTSSNDTMPFSTGFLHPLIVLPPNLCGEENYFIILHELTHIKNMDFFTRYIALLIRSLHWFNPLSHLLLHELELQQEFCADESVLDKLNCEFQNKYGALILKYLTNNTRSLHNATKYLSTFGNSRYGAAKERIKRLKNNVNQIKAPKTSIAVFATAVSVLGNCLTITAYNPPYILTGEVSDQGDYINFRPDDSGTNEITGFHFSNSNYIFIDEAEMWTEINPSQIYYGESETGCPHNRVQGTIQSHHKNSSGNCDIISRQASKCTICGMIHAGDKISSTHYHKCPHSGN